MTSKSITLMSDRSANVLENDTRAGEAGIDGGDLHSEHSTGSTVTRSRWQFWQIMRQALRSRP
jgi:hypothetical protein